MYVKKKELTIFKMYLNYYFVCFKRHIRMLKIRTQLQM